jgi:hypothetical protein
MYQEHSRRQAGETGTNRKEHIQKRNTQSDSIKRHGTQLLIQLRGERGGDNACLERVEAPEVQTGASTNPLGLWESVRLARHRLPQISLNFKPKFRAGAESRLDYVTATNCR